MRPFFDLFTSMPKLLYDFALDIETVTLSSKFQVVITRSVRERMKLSPRMKYFPR